MTLRHLNNQVNYSSMYDNLTNACKREINEVALKGSLINSLIDPTYSGGKKSTPEQIKKDHVIKIIAIATIAAVGALFLAAGIFGISALSIAALAVGVIGVVTIIIYKCTRGYDLDNPNERAKVIHQLAITTILEEVYYFMESNEITLEKIEGYRLLDNSNNPLIYSKFRSIYSTFEELKNKFKINDVEIWGEYNTFAAPAESEYNSEVVASSDRAQLGYSVANNFSSTDRCGRSQRSTVADSLAMGNGLISAYQQNQALNKLNKMLERPRRLRDQALGKSQTAFRIAELSLNLLFSGLKRNAGNTNERSVPLAVAASPALPAAVAPPRPPAMAPNFALHTGAEA